MNSSAIVEARIELACGQLRLPGLAQYYREIVSHALEGNSDHLSFLAACLEYEVARKQEQKQLALLRQAKFPVLKTLQEFQFSKIPRLPKMKVEQLAGGDFVGHHENVICIGKSGTGKSHVAIALGMGVMQQGYRVRFIPVMQLIQELQQAESEYRLPRYLKNWNKYDLVILDELGYIPLGEGGKLLFQFISQRYERGSLIITSNLEFSRWIEVFGDPALTTALLDRLTHHSHILVFEGESHRFRERLSRLEGVSKGE